MGWGRILTLTRHRPQCAVATDLRAVVRVERLITAARASDDVVDLCVARALIDRIAYLIKTACLVPAKRFRATAFLVVQRGKGEAAYAVSANY
jgi:hypothetical protein